MACRGKVQRASMALGDAAETTRGVYGKVSNSNALGSAGVLGTVGINPSDQLLGDLPSAGGVFVANNRYGAYGQSETSAGVYGSGRIGVEGKGTGSSGYGVKGENRSGTGILGEGSAVGVEGVNLLDGVGVRGVGGGYDGVGVYGEGAEAGVEGTSEYGAGGSFSGDDIGVKGRVGNGIALSLPGYSDVVVGGRFTAQGSNALKVGVMGEAGGSGAIVGVLGKAPRRAGSFAGLLSRQRRDHAGQPQGQWRRDGRERDRNVGRAAEGRHYRYIGRGGASARRAAASASLPV